MLGDRSVTRGFSPGPPLQLQLRGRAIRGQTDTSAPVRRVVRRMPSLGVICNAIARRGYLTFPAGGLGAHDHEPENDHDLANGQ
jgi:hypothetical protein